MGKKKPQVIRFFEGPRPKDVWRFNHSSGTMSRPMESFTIEVAADRYDHGAVAVWLICNSPAGDKVETIKRGVEEYLSAPKTCQVEILTEALKEQQKWLKWLTRLVKDKARAENLEFREAVENEIVRLKPQVMRIEEALAALRDEAGLPQENRRKRKSLVKAGTSELTPRSGEECVRMLTGSMYYGIQRAISTGRFEKPDERELWPHAPIKRGNVSALALLKPTEADTQTPESAYSSEELLLWQEKMISLADEMDDRTADVLDCVLFQWMEKVKNEKDIGTQVTIRRDDLLRMLGKKPHPKAGFQYKDKMAVSQAIHNLARLHVRVYEAEWQDTITSKGRTQTIRRHGPVGAAGQRAADLSVLLIDGRAGEKLVWGAMDYDRWSISLGKNIAPFMLAGRQYGLLSKEVLKLNPQKRPYEKRLARYLVWVWRCRAATGNILQPIKVETLYKEIKLDANTKKPALKWKRLEDALDALVELKVVKAWEYGKGYGDRLGQGMAFKEWLQETVTIEPAQVHLDAAAKITRPEPKQKLKPAEPAPSGNFNPARLKAVRLSRGLSQLQAAEELQALSERRGKRKPVDRTLWVKWETGKRKPDDTTKNLLLEWMDGSTGVCHTQ